jgi:hypothetical protein
LEKKILLGLPVCVFYHIAIVFDPIFPRVLGGFPVTRDEITAQGHGAFLKTVKLVIFPFVPLASEEEE